MSVGECRSVAGQENFPNCRELRLRNVPCVPISPLGLKSFQNVFQESVHVRERTGSQNLKRRISGADVIRTLPKRRRLRKLSDCHGPQVDVEEVQHQRGKGSPATCIADSQTQQQRVGSVGRQKCSERASQSLRKGGCTQADGRAGYQILEIVVGQNLPTSAESARPCSSAEAGSERPQAAAQLHQTTADVHDLPVLIDLDCCSQEENGPKAASQVFAGDGGLRRSTRLARHAATRPTARQQLDIKEKRPRNDGRTGQPKTANEATDGPVGVSALLSSPVSCRLERRPGRTIITKRFSGCSSDLPPINCIVGRWEEGTEQEQDGCVRKCMRLPDSFFSDLLGTIGGGTAFRTYEWGGMLKAHWDVGQKEALLRVGSKPGRGLHDRVQVAEGPFSWHSHAILGDSWPNLPSTADLLGVIRDSNLRQGGRGHVHLVVTPIGTWLLQAMERLVHDMYDGGTRRRAEDVLTVQLEQIFDAHKCSVGYPPGAVPAEAPDFWMAVPEHERAIRNALRKKGQVQAQVTAYAAQLQEAGFVVGFAGHGAINACFPIVYKSANQNLGFEKSQQSGMLSSYSAGQSVSLFCL